MHMYNSRFQHHAFKYAASQNPNRHRVYVFSYKSDLNCMISFMHICVSIQKLKNPGWEIPSGIYRIEGPGKFSIESAEVQLAVSGGQALFTLGLPMLALPL